MLPRSLFAVAVALGLLACTGAGSAQFRVVGVQHAPADEIVLHVQVVNRTQKVMRLQRLEYTFAGAGHREITLDHRQIEPGAAVVVEVPIVLEAQTVLGGSTLKGKLFAELDQLIQAFPVSALVGPGS